MHENEFEPFFKSRYEVATFSAHRFLNNHSDAEELVLDSFLATWKNFSNIHDEAHAFRYLQLVLKRKCLSYNRDQRRKKEVYVYDVLSDGLDCSEYDLKEIHSLVIDDLSKKFQQYIDENCAKREKQIMTLFFNGKKNIEIASELGLSEKTIWTIKDRVFARFRNLFKNEDQL